MIAFLFLLLSFGSIFGDEPSYTTTYRYEKTGKLEAKEVIRLGNPDTFYSAERYLYNPDGSLKTTYHEDSFKTLLLCTTFVYNTEGKLIQETLYGNLTGNNQAPLILNGGLPLENGIEHTAIRYSYNNAGLLAEKQEEHGMTHVYSYIPGTSLVESELLFSEGKLILRHFYSYNQEQWCTESITDDGVTQELADFTGVTERRITRRKPGPFGKPAEIEELYLDVATGTEKLKKRTHLLYNSYGRIEKKEIYDEHGEYKYSLEKQEIDPSLEPRLVRDGLGRPTKIIHAYPYEEGKKPIYPLENRQYDTLGRMIAAAPPQDPSLFAVYTVRNKPVALLYGDGTKELFEYDLKGHLVRTTGKDGTVTRFLHDAYGHVLQINRYDSKGAFLDHQSAQYNSFQMIASQDVKGFTTKYSYDSAGRLRRSEKETAPGLVITEYVYDSLSQLSEYKEWLEAHPKDYTRSFIVRGAANKIIETRVEDANGNILRQETFPQHTSNLVTGKRSLLWNLLDSIIDAISSLQRFVDEHLSFSHYIREDLEKAGLAIAGKSNLILLGFYSHDIERGVFGQGEVHSKVRMSMINGLLNGRTDFFNSMQIIGQAHKGANIHYILSPTEGWSGDVKLSFLVKCGYTSRQAHLLAKMWKELIQEMGGSMGEEKSSTTPIVWELLTLRLPVNFSLRQSKK